MVRTQRMPGVAAQSAPIAHVSMALCWLHAATPWLRRNQPTYCHQTHVTMQGWWAACIPGAACVHHWLQTPIRKDSVY